MSEAVAGAEVVVEMGPVIFSSLAENAILLVRRTADKILTDPVENMSVSIEFSCTTPAATSPANDRSVAPTVAAVFCSRWNI